MNIRNSKQIEKINNHSTYMVEPEPIHDEEENKEEEVITTSRCFNERQRQVIVAIFGIGLSGLMTFSLIYLLNKIKG